MFVLVNWFTWFDSCVLQFVTMLSWLVSVLGLLGLAGCSLLLLRGCVLYCCIWWCMTTWLVVCELWLGCYVVC